MDNKKQRATSGYMMKLLFLILGFVTVSSSAQAWGPHDKITQAALAVVPDGDKALGAENFRAMIRHSILPDLPFQREAADLGDFYADDYLLFRARPEYWTKHSADHSMPLVRDLWIPHFERALQALRTETPVNACRYIAVLLHFVQDTGAPPHAYEPQPCPFHSELEGWFPHDQIHIKGYKPILLGQTDQEASQRFVVRMEALAAYSQKRAKRALPFMASLPPQRSEVEPIILESALECARVTADVLHTLFELRQKPDGGASLTGVVTGATFPLRNEHGARLVLLDAEGSVTPFTTMATSSDLQPGNTGWSGHYVFRNLPEGVYRLLSCRTASSPEMSESVCLKKGGTIALNINMKATLPTGNIVENPDGSVSTLLSDVPDRWRRKNGIWMSSFIWVNPGISYRCGAIAKKTATLKARFTFCGKADKYNKVGPYRVVEIDLGPGDKREQKVALAHDRCKAYVEVVSDEPLRAVIEKVWLVPDLSAEEKKPVRLATYNISRASRGGDLSWSNRVGLVRGLIERQGIDLLAAQEVMPEQVADLSASEEWRYAGLHRKEKDGEGEACTIFFKGNRFKLLDTGTFWLSENPQNPGSISWGAAWPRICTWVKLLDSVNQSVFFVFNTHLDNGSRMARERGMRVILDHIRAVAKDCPVMLIGDMNDESKKDGPLKIAESMLHDSYHLSQTPPVGHYGTYNGFEFNVKPTARIDYIYVSDGIGVLNYMTDSQAHNNQYPSDHFPVICDVVIQ